MKNLVCSLVYIVIALSVGIAQAAPAISNVSGSISHGESVVITGSGFGSKASGPPYIWDTVEDGNCDTTATVGTWTTIYEEVVTNTDQKHAGSYSCRGDFDAGYSRLIKTVSAMPDGQKLYASMWRRRENAVGTANQKLFRFYPSGDVYPNTVVSTGTATGVITVENCGGGTASGAGIRAAILEDTWQLEEYIVQFSSGLNQGDGILTFKMDNVQISSYSNLVSRCTGEESNMSQIMFCNQGTMNGYVWMDDLYLDLTWQRVVIGNADTLAASTHIELQPPTAWADGEITITFNEGTFASGDVYVYVFDTNNVSNSTGYEVTLGEGEDTTDPTCTITTNSGSNFETSTQTISLAGTASDNVEVSSVAWACATCTPTSGAATGTTEWTISSGSLGEGANTITVTATDSSENTGNDSIVVTYTPAAPTPTTMTGVSIVGGSVQ